MPSGCCTFGVQRHVVFYRGPCLHGSICQNSSCKLIATKLSVLCCHLANTIEQLGGFAMQRFSLLVIVKNWHTLPRHSLTHILVDALGCALMPFCSVCHQFFDFIPGSAHVFRIHLVFSWPSWLSLVATQFPMCCLLEEVFWSPATQCVSDVIYLYLLLYSCAWMHQSCHLNFLCFQLAVSSLLSLVTESSNSWCLSWCAWYVFTTASSVE